MRLSISRARARAHNRSCTPAPYYCHFRWREKKKRGGCEESCEDVENDTRSTTLRNVTRHRCRFRSRVSFRRYCHSRPIKNAGSHGRGVSPNVLIKEHAIKIREAEKGSINLWAFFLFPKEDSLCWSFRIYIYIRTYSISIILNGQNRARSFK